MKIRFLFHKGKDSLVGRGIVLWTGFLALFYNWKVLKYNYSHEEEWTPDDDGEFTKEVKWAITLRYAYTMFTGRCFSSTTRGDANGVRFAPASEVLKHPERWDYIEVEVDAERLEITLAEAEKLVGRKYDYLGLFGFFNPFPFQDKMKEYCSEVLDWFKFMSRIHRKRQKRVSPRRAAYLLAKKYGEPKSLV